MSLKAHRSLQALLEPPDAALMLSVPWPPETQFPTLSSPGRSPEYTFGFKRSIQR